MTDAADAVAIHGGERVARELLAQRTRVVYTLCGGHISPILTAAKALGIRIVDTRDEATAVFAADATARLTGVPGVAAVTAGPGLTNAITAIKNAQLAQSPLVLLGGAAPTLLQGRGALQDIDQRALVRPHVKLVLRVRRVRDLAPAVRRAFAVARSGVPGPVFVECPLDLLYPEALVREMHGAAARSSLAPGKRLLQWYVRRHLDRVFARPVPESAFEVADRARRVPPVDARAVRRAADALARASRPLLVVGSQATVDVDALAHTIAAIERLAVPTYLSGMARGLLGAAHPLLLRHRRREALREADCVVLAGVPCDFRLDYGRHVGSRATLVGANLDRRDLRLNRSPDVGVVCDPGAFLRALAALRPAPGEAGAGAHAGTPAAVREWHDSLRARDAAREREIDASAATPGAHVNPVALLRELDAQLPADAILVADGGDFVGTAAYVVHARGPLAWLDPGVFGTLGVGAGFALGAALARPGREVWILYGDGAAGYGLVEFDTFVRHGVPVIALVGNDAGWTQIAREQVKVLGDPVGTELARTAYDAVAAGFGAVGLRLDSPARMREVIAEARRLAASGRPVLVNAWLDRTDFREGSISM